MSVNVYDAPRERWLQTWVDDEGNVLRARGSEARRRNGAALRPPQRRGPEPALPMRFHDIEDDSFTWSWERSADGGASFSLAWRIDYRARGRLAGCRRAR